MLNEIASTMLQIAAFRRKVRSWFVLGLRATTVQGLSLAVVCLPLYFIGSGIFLLIRGGLTMSMKPFIGCKTPVFGCMSLMETAHKRNPFWFRENFGPLLHVSTSMPDIQRMACQDLVDLYVSLGLNALYVTDANYGLAFRTLDKKTVLVYIHSEGEDVVLLGDNEIDTVRLKFRNNGEPVRA